MIIPDGRSGGNRNSTAASTLANDYTRWEIGGEPQLKRSTTVGPSDYTRWEIGGEPQRTPLRWGSVYIIPDGRSGGNRNSAVPPVARQRIIPDGRSGGNRNRVI